MSHRNSNSGAVSVSVKIKELRNLIVESKLETRISDEAFLRRFLILRRFDTLGAFTRLRHYETFRKKNAETWLRVDRNTLEDFLKSRTVEILGGRDRKWRRVIWIRAGRWDTSKYTPDYCLQIAGLLAEIILIIYKEDPLSISVIFDMKNFGMKHVNALSASFAKKMVFFLSQCIPLHIHAIYVIREPKVFSVIYSCFKPFLDEPMKKIIHIYGHNLRSLQEHIKADSLPVELGGCIDDVDPGTWIAIVNSDFVKNELRALGYRFT